MKKTNIIVTILILVMYTTIIAQNPTIENIIGDWKLSNVDRKFKVNDSKNESNFFFYDAYENHSFVTLNNSSIKLIRFNKVVVYEYKISDTELTIIFYSADKSKQSYTTYNYKIENNNLILWKEDPILIEKYTFNK